MGTPETCTACDGLIVNGVHESEFSPCVLGCSCVAGDGRCLDGFCENRRTRVNDGAVA